MAASGDNKELIEKTDALHEEKKFEEEYEILIQHKDTTDADVLWRLARAATDVGKLKGEPERKTKIYEADGFARRALELDDKNFACHKWVGILLDYIGQYEGTKKRIQNAYVCKERFEAAMELNPKDATTKHAMGVWCFSFADLAWYERKIAQVAFGTPPSSTYEDALKYFEEAESVEPNFYNQNKVMIGKTLIKMKQNDRAKEILMAALQHEDKTVDDAKARQDAKDLLKSIGVKV